MHNTHNVRVDPYDNITPCQHNTMYQVANIVVCGNLYNKMCQLPQHTSSSDDIEMRLCTDQGSDDEDMVVEMVDIYII